MVEVISFDLEGTLVTLDFSESVWHQGIPMLYAQDRGLSLKEAMEIVFQEYERVGEERVEWYDIKYWFKHLNLKGDYIRVFDYYRRRVTLYPETIQVLEQFSKSYTLILATNTSREFLNVLTEKISKHFKYVFSATSDFGIVKKNVEFYRRVAEALNVNPAEIAHVGDRWEDDYIVPRMFGIQAYYLDRACSRTGEHVVRDLIEFSSKIHKTK
ncbi:MAG: HAD family hydrolase [Candidatus Bathyarchaeota archaeon]|nr:HAD family hydrolase [Candidatus Bathyarchaeota archaeon]